MLLSRGAVSQPSRVLYDSALANTNLCEYRLALRFADAAVTRGIGEMGEEDTAVASYLDLQATILSTLGLYARGDDCFREALTIRGQILGEEHPDTWTSYYHLSRSYLKQEMSKEALCCLEPFLLPYRQGRPVGHGAIASCFMVAAGAYYAEGRFDEAEECFHLCLDGIARSGYKHEYEHSLAYHLYGWFLIDIGKAREAEAMLTDAVKTFEFHELPGPPLARALCILGEAYHALGRMLEAEQAYLKSNRMFRELTGRDDETVLANLGVLYQAMRRYDDAERLALRSIAIMEPGSSEVGRQLGNLAGAYIGQGRYAEAETTCVKALDIQRKHYGMEHHLVARTLHRIGMILYYRHGFAAADSLFAEACRIGLKTLAPGDDRNSRYALWWGKASFALGYAARADSLMRASMRHQLQYLHRSWADLTEKEKNQFYGMLKRNFEHYFSFVRQRQRTSRELVGDLYDFALASKSIVQESTRLVRDHIQRSGDTSMLSVFREWSAIKSRLSHMTKTQMLNKDSGMVDSLVLCANTLERGLTRSSRTFAESIVLRPTTWRDVRSELGAREAAVEIVRFRDVDSVTSKHIRYAALVMRGDAPGPPIFVDLCDGDSLEGGWLVEYKKLLLPSNRAGEEEYRVTRTNAWKHFWAPLAEHLSGIHRVYFSADGVYHLINPDILSRDGVTALIDELELRRITSTRSVFERRELREPVRHALLMGAPEFGASDLADESTTATMRGGGVSWEPLRNSAREIDEISALLRHGKWTTDLLVGADATKTALERAAPPGLLHISTHGYFQEDTASTTDPLLREIVDNTNYHLSYMQSGLALAGANMPAGAGNDDGRLTAFDATTLNLRGTALVVLSACETGRGYLRNGEGVYGLQRGFLLAGARAVLMSLWKVEDGVTRELMVEFYRAWLRGGEPHSALRKAILRLRKIHPWLSPADWGAFVVVE